MKYLSIDIETTGLPWEGGKPIEIAGVVDDLVERKPIDELPRFRFLIWQPDAVWHPKVLAMHMRNGLLQEIANGLEKIGEVVAASCAGEALLHRVRMLGLVVCEKITVAGKNVAKFDVPILKSLGIDTEEAFHARTLDPSILYARADDKHVPDLAECLRRAGLPPQVSHRAMDDALAVVQLIRYKMLPVEHRLVGHRGETHGPLTTEPGGSPGEGSAMAPNGPSLVVDWSRAPAWADFHAFDRNGDGYWFDRQPAWNAEKGWWVVEGVQEASPFIGRFARNSGTAERTLSARPKATVIMTTSTVPRWPRT